MKVPGVGRLFCVLLALLGLAAPATGHGDHDPGLEEQLVDAGSAMMVGRFDAAQEGALVVVPHFSGPLLCDPHEAGYLLPLGPEAGVAFASNATHVGAFFALSGNGTGYTAFAVDSLSAVRTLYLMQEHAVALHALGALSRIDGPNGTTTTQRGGVMGVPQPIGPAVHAIDHAVEGGGILIDYDEVIAPAELCLGDDAGRVGMTFRRADLSDALGQGVVVHAVALHDPNIPQWLPRPIDNSSLWAQYNLYLSRQGEDPHAVRAALDPKPNAPVWLPLVGLAVALVWFTRP